MVGAGPGRVEAKHSYMAMHIAAVLGSILRSWHAARGPSDSKGG